MELTPDDRRFLADYDASIYERPSVAVDVVCLTAMEGSLWVLATRRAEPPQKGRHGLPGGFVRMDESLDDAAARVLSHKAGLRGIFTEQLYSFGSPGRDPRTRVISVAYYALVAPEAMRQAIRARGAADGVTMLRVDVPWAGEEGGPAFVEGPQGGRPRLAFDHEQILGTAVLRLRGKLGYSPVGFQLLGPEFTLRSLQEVHEAILGEPLSKMAFRKRMLASGRLEATGELEPLGEGRAHRPAELYRFTRASAT